MGFFPDKLPQDESIERLSETKEEYVPNGLRKASNRNQRLQVVYPVDAVKAYDDRK